MDWIFDEVKNSTFKNSALVKVIIQVSLSLVKLLGKMTQAKSKDTAKEKNEVKG